MNDLDEIEPSAEACTKLQEGSHHQQHSNSLRCSHQAGIRDVWGTSYTLILMRPGDTAVSSSGERRRSAHSHAPNRPSRADHQRVCPGKWQGVVIDHVACALYRAGASYVDTRRRESPREPEEIAKRNRAAVFGRSDRDESQTTKLL